MDYVGILKNFVPTNGINMQNTLKNIKTLDNWGKFIGGQMKLLLNLFCISYENCPSNNVKIEPLMFL